MAANLNTGHGDPRIVYPYAERNKADILNALSPHFQKAERVLELASGSGQHVVTWAQTFPTVRFHPSEIDDPALLASINAYINDLPNIMPPLTLNATCTADWDRVQTLVARNGLFDVIYMGNVLHIAPWDVTLALAKNLHTVLAVGGVFVLYGAFKRDGKFTTASNEEFDQQLRARNSEWGLRDIADVAAEFEKSGLTLREIKDMPANNFILVFKKGQ
ncbi:hypothetical protein HDU87_003849 [Geranomyces variabilis]|uniref:Uncharacterized protein n=1 Tax=Geranomyces variabilis TaxID=109894 RepID=A0AAD5XQ81_9FUNG|nr:hypothetical protein HDU87_003849 [Geranomyces variabilis]